MVRRATQPLPRGLGRIRAAYARLMPSLTRDEAVAPRRTAARPRVRHRSRPDRRGRRGSVRLDHDDPVLRATRPGGETFVELKRAELHEVTLNGVRARPGGAWSTTGCRCPASPPTNELVVRATMAYSQHRRGPAPVRRPGGRRGLPLRADVPRRRAARLRLLRPARPQGAGHADRVARRRTGRSRATAPGRGSRPAGGSSPRPSRWPPTSSASSPGPTTCAATATTASRSPSTAAAASPPTWTRTLDELFGITKACLDRYHELFGVRYPFGKYDQAFVPEFNAGAMENPGLVTIRDEFVFRSAVTDAERRGARRGHRARDGPHVVRRSRHHAVVGRPVAQRVVRRVHGLPASSPRPPGSPARGPSSPSGARVGATRPTSARRPIRSRRSRCRTPALALLNFDGISYAKGAAVLRQLAAWIGDDAFLAGLRAHFARACLRQRHAGRSAGRAVAEPAGGTCARWAERLAAPGRRSTRCARRSVSGRTAGTPRSSRPDGAGGYPTLRPHRIGVGVYSGGSRLQRRARSTSTRPSTAAGPPCRELVGVQAGDLLLLNDGDLDLREDPIRRGRAAPRCRGPCPA